MICSLGLKNFKCFTDAKVEFGGLNVFAGANGTGKSTLIQALLILFQSVESGQLEQNRLQLNGPLVALGTGLDVLYKRSDTDLFEIIVQDETGTQTVIAEVSSSESQHTLPSVIVPLDVGLPCLERKVFYLSADRLGPQNAYPMSLDGSAGNEVGRRGEFAPLLYGRSRTHKVTNEILLLETADKKQFADVETQFTLWMQKLFPGFQAHTDSLDKMDSIMLGLNLQKQIGAPEFLRPINVGFGVSVVFPIILAGLLAGEDTTLIVENPEAHLHPSAQSIIGEFFARVAAGGAQVFIETHSDHVVNGMRIAFKNEVIQDGELRFFAFTKTDEYGSQCVTEVPLDETGEFSERPDSFFDQTDKDLKLIYHLE